MLSEKATKIKEEGKGRSYYFSILTDSRTDLAHNLYNKAGIISTEISESEGDSK